MEVLTKHFCPPPSEIVQRFKFNSRVRQPGESVATYIAELRALSQYCNFDNTLELMLRDRLVCGINDAQIQRRLLAEKSLTYAKAQEIALALESAVQGTKDIQRSLPNDPVHTVSQQHTSSVKCFRCGRANHKAPQCRFKDAVCSNCKKTGHLAKVCRSKQPASKAKLPANVIAEETVQNEQEEYSLFTIQDTRATATNTDPIQVTMTLNGKPTLMEIDTGAAVSIMTETKFMEISSEELQGSLVNLCTYSGEKLSVKGEAMCNVEYDGKMYVLPLVIVAGSGPTLIGRNWLRHIPINWSNLFQPIHLVHDQLAQLLQSFDEVFADELGALQGSKASIYIDPNIPPRFCKARSLPYAMKEKVEKELQKLEAQGIISPVKYSKWAAPIVPVLKQDKQSVRICGDYKLTANRASRVEHYPLPKIEDLFATLGGGTLFTKLDMSQAYLQVLVDDQSKEVLTINTHKGLFVYNRLPFGVSSAPGIFQRTMESLLQGIPHVLVYLDDVLITGPSQSEHLNILKEVLLRFKQAGLRLKKQKCQFLMKSVDYLGHVIDRHGIRPSSTKVKAIKAAPKPRNVLELRAYLGLLTYYGKFLPNVSTVLAPLYQLLRKDVKWFWGELQQQAFLKSKDMLTSSALLVHYDPSQPLVLSCDASQYGIGAVLSQVYNGDEKPVAYASRTLNTAERNYSQLEKEALALIFGVKKFHTYLFGHKFTLNTDHKPLQSLFSESKPVPAMASGRIQCWALALASYEYIIKFKKGPTNTNADALSRLPVLAPDTEVPVPAELVLLMEHMSTGPLTASQVKSMTQRDPVLSRVHSYVLRGWPTSVDSSFNPFSSRRQELSVCNGCVLWGNRVIIPKVGRQRILEELHDSHQGMSRMKERARMVVWWPNIDKEIESMASCCAACQASRNLPPVAPLHPWSFPERPWSRLHMDYAGPIDNHMLLVVIDAFSKWIEVFPVKSATSSVTITKLRALFATHGIPDTIVSDNGTPFVSAEMREFLSANGVRQITSSPYHPASNGLAERAVQTCKAALKKMVGNSLDTKLQRVLLNYRTTPQGTTGVPPCQLLMGRQLKTRLDLVLPDITKQVEHAQMSQKQCHDGHSTTRSFQQGDKVLVRNYRSHPSWLPGIVKGVLGPVSYQVELKDGQLWKRHVDQLLKDSAQRLDKSDVDKSDVDKSDVENQELIDIDIPVNESANDGDQILRRSSRIRRPPNRLNL